ncbi:MAG: 1-acyl-sn-glycerol-3-phosphate acyltransferase [Bacteroidaceae bacterium]|nr:1-acyl-sn-glycerol-3-phosphate acyltransferase [Bacteroidaceae bacterium]
MQVYDKNFAYTLLRIFWVNPIIKLSLRRLTVRGKENLPKDGAIIIGSNHTSALLDPLVILRTMNRATVFMTRADIFRRPFLQKVFTFLKMLPIFRIRDGYAAVKQNEEIIAKCGDVLQHGYPLALFPEATHRPKHSLLPLSKGIFHIALDANKRFGHERPVYIVPMGLEYGRYFRYRSTVVATYGEPINVTEFVKQHENEVTPARLLAMLREELASRMSKLIAYVPDTEDYDAQWELTKLCTAQCNPLSPAERLTLNQTVIKRLVEKKETDTPEATAALYADAINFKKERRLYGIHPSSTSHRHPLAASIGNTIALLCALPYYLFCAITMAPSWIVSHIIVSKLKDKAFNNTARLGVNLALCGLLVIIWGIVALCTLHTVPAVLCIALLIPAVAFFYDYNTFALHTLSDWKWTMAKHLHPRLKEILRRCK